MVVVLPEARRLSSSASQKKFVKKISRLPPPRLGEVVSSAAAMRVFCRCTQTVYLINNHCIVPVVRRSSPCPPTRESHHPVPVGVVRLLGEC